MPWGQVPVLYINGEPLTQTVAICRYLAELHLLKPATALHCARADAVAEAVSDITNRAAEVRRATDPQTKLALRSVFLETRLPLFLEQLERQLSDDEFLCGDEVRVTRGRHQGHGGGGGGLQCAWPGAYPKVSGGHPIPGAIRDRSLTRWAERT